MGAYLALAGLQLVGGFQQADIIRQNGDLQNNISDMNARFADVDAHNALEAGYTSADRYQTTVDQVIASDRAAYASEGVSIGYGTAGQVEADNHVAGLVNTLQIQRSARDAAMGYEGQAINLRLGGQMTSLQANLNASATQSAGIFKALGSYAQADYIERSAGKGRDSTTGSEATPGTQNRAPATVNLNAKGDGVAAPAHLYGNGFGWFPDAEPGPGKTGGQPGFFGHGPRPSYNGSMDESYDRYSSFTGEVG